MIGKAEIDLKLIFHLIGFLLVIEGVFMLLGLPFSIYNHEEHTLALLLSFLITSGSGGAIWFFTRKKNRDTINKREGFLVVSLTWIVISLFGTLPFLLSRTIPSFTPPPVQPFLPMWKPFRRASCSGAA